MTYKEVIEAFMECSLMNISVNSFYEGDVYEYNKQSNVNYPAVVLTPQTHGGTNFYNTYRFSIFFVDRLTSDRRNKINIQSEGIQTLKEIINRMSEIYDMDVNYDLSFNVFTEMFADECAGVYYSVSVDANDEVRECFTDKEIECRCN